MLSISASRSRSSSCLCTMNSPCLQIIAWPKWNGSPHTHTDGKSLICQLYRKWMASRNSRLIKVNCISFTEMTVSQLEAPFSAATSAVLLVLSGRELFTSSNVFCRSSSLSLRALVCNALESSSFGRAWSWLSIFWTRGVVTCWQSQEISFFTGTCVSYYCYWYFYY